MQKDPVVYASYLNGMTSFSKYPVSFVVLEYYAIVMYTL